MPTSRSVSQIKSSLLRPALTSHFEVEVPVLDDLRYILGSEQSNLNLACAEATLPGSQLATLENNNDRAGVTEKHAYRRMFDGQIDLTFYVDAGNYLPIKFFEGWIKYIMNENTDDVKSKSYFYRAKYPNDYMSDQGLVVRKFERDYKSTLTYNFVRSFPLSISSMPVTYDSSSLLKCTVTMSYIRYYVDEITLPQTTQPQVAPTTPTAQAQFNASNLTLPGLEGAGALAPNTNSGAIDRRVEAGLPGVGRVTFVEPSIFDTDYNFRTNTLNR